MNDVRPAARIPVRLEPAPGRAECRRNAPDDTSGRGKRKTLSLRIPAVHPDLVASPQPRNHTLAHPESCHLMGDKIPDANLLWDVT